MGKPLRPNSLRDEKLEILKHYEAQGRSCPIETSYWSPSSGIRYMFQKRLSTILSLFHKVNGKLILDVGCGSGAYTYYLSKNGASVCALDLSHSYLLNAKRVVDDQTAQFLQAEAEQLPFKDEAFDWILCTEVIEHITNPQQLLTEIVRVLKEKGTCILSTPSKYSPTEIFRKLMFGPQYEHLHFWTEREFKKIVALKDIKVVKSEHCLFFCYFLRKFLSIHPSLIPVIDVIEDALSKLPLIKNFAWCRVFKCVK